MSDEDGMAVYAMYGTCRNNGACGGCGSYQTGIQSNQHGRNASRSAYDCSTFISIPEFMGCVAPGSSSISGSYTISDAVTGVVLDNTVSDGTGYTPAPLTEEELEHMEDPSDPDYYGNATNPILPMMCDDTIRSGERATTGTATVKPSIKYERTTATPGLYIIVTDPPVLRLTGRYVRGDFNGEREFFAEPGETPAHVTSKSSPVPEKGALADTGYSDMDSPGQRTLFRKTLSSHDGRIRIYAAATNETGSTVHFALQFRGNMTGSVVHAIHRAGNTEKGKCCEEAFLSNRPTFGAEDWNVPYARIQTAFLVRDNADLNTPGPCTFTLNQRDAYNIRNGTGYDVTVELEVTGEVTLDVIAYKNFDAVTSNLNFWGTYPFSRYCTGYSVGNPRVNSVGNPGSTFRWIVADSDREGWLPVTINEWTYDTTIPDVYDWGTHGLVKFPSKCTTNDAVAGENCNRKYSIFYQKTPDALTETFPVTVKRANYTAVEYLSPYVGTPAGSASAWPNYAVSETQVPCITSCTGYVFGRDGRTPHVTYAYLANWGVTYTENLYFVNMGPTKKRTFTYVLANVDSTEGVRRLVAVRVTATMHSAADDSVLPDGAMSATRTITLTKPQKPEAVITVCCPPGTAYRVFVEYILGAGSPFGVGHAVQMNTALKCAPPRSFEWQSPED